MRTTFRKNWRTASAAMAIVAVAALALAACSTPSEQAASNSSPTSESSAAETTPSDSSTQPEQTSDSSDTSDTTESSEPVNDGPLTIAYLSFAVANSFDAPMLAAAQAVAADNNAKLTVFDANNDPQAQYSQLQDAITSKKYDGVIVQPIFGTGLIDLVTQAVNDGIKVVSINQILGPDMNTNEPQVPGLSASVAIPATQLGKNLGEQTVAACAARSLDPCVIGYLYDIKASALDVAIRDAFDAAVAGSPVQIAAEGESYFTATVALGAVQDMLTAHPDITLVVGSDQGIQGAVQAIEAAKKTGDVSLVGYGGSATGVAGVAAGNWSATVLMTPASEGRLGTQALIKALRTGEDSGGINPTEGLPEVITKDNASEFTAEWVG